MGYDKRADHIKTIFDDRNQFKFMKYDKDVYKGGKLVIKNK